MTTPPPDPTRAERRPASELRVPLDVRPPEGGTASHGGGAGTAIPEMEEVVLPAEGMDCPSCAATATRGLLEVEGVLSVDPDIIGQRVRVGFDPRTVAPERIRSSLGTLGYGAPPSPSGIRGEGEDTTPGPARPRIPEFLAELPPHIGLGGIFWSLTIAASLLGESRVLVGLLAGMTVITAGQAVFPRAWAAARRGILDMHVLMAVAAVGALLIGEFVEAGAVLFLFAVARGLEQRTLNRARSEVRSLMDLSPVEATVLRHGHQVKVPVDAVREGERVLVRPGERVAVDGTVLTGASEVDAAAITGESMPEPRFPGDRIFAGSVNGSGALEIRCDQPAADSALSRILKGIEDARARKSPTEAFVDRFARIYTPLVMVGALLVAVAPPLLGLGDWADWGYRALVLVVIACPCALVISTPVTVVSALTGAARRGILIKSGVHLEVLGSTRVVALDKTGTLTEGKPWVSDVVEWNGASREEIVAMAATAESRSEHPIARALLAEARRAHLPLADGVEMTALPGRGARARSADRSILVGSPRLFGEEGLLVPGDLERIEELQKTGGTVVLVGWNDADPEPLELRGALILSDRMRPGVEALLPALRREGVRKIVLMSGDRAPAVEAAARSAVPGARGFDLWRGDLLPEEKVEWIRALRAEHGPVMMVGDGVNDAPALAAADVGVAMGRGGTGVALDTAEVALMEDDLDRIPLTFRLGRKAARIIRANIAFALAVKIVFVLLGGAGHATLWMAVLADMGSSLAVILNGLRTLRA